MNVPKMFWVFLALFELVFGSLVFVVTRSYYRDQPADVRTTDSALPSPGALGTGTPAIAAPALDLTAARTPEELARLADEHFANRQYDAAVVLYERLLDQDRNNVDLLNNLAITLHYVGRSEEALSLINEGVVADPGHQRIWLTRGFVLSQLGRTEEAVSALEKTVELNATTPIADSARKMLSEIGTQ